MSLYQAKKWRNKLQVLFFLPYIPTRYSRWRATTFVPIIQNGPSCSFIALRSVSSEVEQQFPPQLRSQT